MTTIQAGVAFTLLLFSANGLAGGQGKDEHSDASTQACSGFGPQTPRDMMI